MKYTCTYTGEFMFNPILSAELFCTTEIWLQRHYIDPGKKHPRFTKDHIFIDDGTGIQPGEVVVCIQGFLFEFLKPWWIKLSGEIYWEDSEGDYGKLYAKDFEVELVVAKLIYPRPSWDIP